jgi:anti-sigma factor ChrR (cupin superfamily)
MSEIGKRASGSESVPSVIVDQPIYNQQRVSTTLADISLVKTDHFFGLPGPVMAIRAAPLWRWRGSGWRWRRVFANESK